MNTFNLKLAVVPVLGAVLLFGAAPAFSAEQNKLKPGARIAGISQQHARNDGRRDNGGYRNERRNNDHRHERRNDHRNHGRNEYRHDKRHNHNHRYTVPRYHAYPGYWRDYHRGHHAGYRHRYYNGRHYYYNHIGFYFPGYGYIHHGHRHSRHCPHWHFEGFAAGLVLGAILSH